MTYIGKTGRFGAEISRLQEGAESHHLKSMMSASPIKLAQSPSVIRRTEAEPTRGGIPRKYSPDRRTSQSIYPTAYGPIERGLMYPADKSARMRDLSGPNQIKIDNLLPKAGKSPRRPRRAMMTIPTEHFLGDERTPSKRHNSSNLAKAESITLAKTTTPKSPKKPTIGQPWDTI